MTLYILLKIQIKIYVFEKKVCFLYGGYNRLTFSTNT